MNIIRNLKGEYVHEVFSSYKFYKNKNLATLFNDNKTFNLLKSLRRNGHSVIHEKVRFIKPKSEFDHFIKHEINSKKEIILLVNQPKKDSITISIKGKFQPNGRDLNSLFNK